MFKENPDNNNITPAGSDSAPAGKKTPLLGMTLPQLQQVVARLGLPRFNAGQIARWLYVARVTDLDAMTDLSKAARHKLAAAYCVGREAPLSAQRSQDGTVKYLFDSGCGLDVEAVYIPDRDRATLCVSSQVGCKMGCAFCMTGRQGFEGQLTAADILNQIYSLPERDTLTNIVFMGQGEPMDNLDAVLRATAVLTADWGFGWSPRRITVSTVGLRKGLERFLRESECHLAISLHNPFPEERARLMPAERGLSLAEMVGILERYDFCRRQPRDPGAPRQRRLSFEYIVFDGVNDSPRHAQALIRLLSNLDCRINLIRFHQIPDSPLCGVNDARMTAFRDSLTRRGLFATIRASRGQDIMAACGLLSTAEKERQAREAAGDAGDSGDSGDSGISG